MANYDPTKDPNASFAASPITPARKAYRVTAADADLPTYAKALRANTAGTLVFVPEGNADSGAGILTWTVAAGEYVLLQVRQVRLGTTAVIDALHD